MSQGKCFSLSGGAVSPTLSLSEVDRSTSFKWMYILSNSTIVFINTFLQYY